MEIWGFLAFFCLSISCLDNNGQVLELVERKIMRLLRTNEDLTDQLK